MIASVQYEKIVVNFIGFLVFVQQPVNSVSTAHHLLDLTSQMHPSSDNNN